MKKMGSLRSCELCSKEAALHCEADSAYLCWGCDAKVHGANFLAARHLRIILCCRCHQYTGLSTCVKNPNIDRCLCSECSNSDCSDEISTSLSGRRCRSPTKNGVIASGLKTFFGTEDGDDRRLLEASRSPVLEVSVDKGSCSYSEHATKLDGQIEGRQKKHMIRRHAVALRSSGMKVQAILRRWYRNLNLRNPSTVTLAMYLAEKGLKELGGLFRQKWRICLAASIWLAATICENQACLPSIKKVEECSGVPSKLILVVESRLVTILDLKMHEEGWAESDTLTPS